MDVIYDLLLMNNFPLIKHHPEPVGSVAPKISGGRLQEVEVQSNQSLSILCLGQSFPVPTFR